MIEKASAKPQTQKEHTLSLENREKIFLSGIEEVISFDEHTVTMNTVLGAMSIEGEQLHILSLSLESGHIAVEGHVDTIYYENRTEKVKRGFFSRLTR